MALVFRNCQHKTAHLLSFTGIVREITIKRYGAMLWARTLFLDFAPGNTFYKNDDALNRLSVVRH